MAVHAARAVLILVLLPPSDRLGCHCHFSDFARRREESSSYEAGGTFADKLGLMVSFEHPVYSNGYFLGFDGWLDVNRRYGVNNVTFLIRVEFEARGGDFREGRLRKRYRRFLLPGALWVELATRQMVIHKASNLSDVKVRNRSSVDVWLIKPRCFIRHHGVQRIQRVANALKLKIARLHWLAKINFDEEEAYGPREIMEVGRALTKVTGVQCSWLHPPLPSRYSSMNTYQRSYDSRPSLAVSA